MSNNKKLDEFLKNKDSILKRYIDISTELLLFLESIYDFIGDENTLELERQELTKVLAETEDGVLLSRLGTINSYVFAPNDSVLIKYLMDDIVSNNVDELFNLNDVFDLLSIEYLLEKLIESNRLGEEDLIKFNKVNVRKKVNKFN